LCGGGFIPLPREKPPQGDVGPLCATLAACVLHALPPPPEEPPPEDRRVELKKPLQENFTPGGLTSAEGIGP